MNITWDGNNYKNNFNFVHEYGKGVMDLIDFQKEMEILDLGCGNGALTKQFSDLGYHVVGIDSSKSMLEIARKDYPELTFIEADATDFHLDHPVDCIFSNAVFHWISDQDALISCIAGNLKEGGQLVCEFGGYGCAQTVHKALEKQFNLRGLKYPRTFYFPTIGEYTPLLEKHGLLVKTALLFDRKTIQKGENGVMNWINMFDLAPFEGLNENLATEIKEAAVEELKDVLCEDGVWFVDYVRIRIKAVKYDRK